MVENPDLLINLDKIKERHRKLKNVAVVIGSVFAPNAANAGSLRSQLSLSEFSYTYAVENGETEPFKWAVFLTITLVWSPAL